MSKQGKIYGMVFAALGTVIAGGFYIYVDSRGQAGPVESERTNIHTNAPKDVEVTPPSSVATPSPSDAN